MHKSEKPDLRGVVARNLRYFMARPDAQYKNANQLAGVCGLSPNSIRYLLDPKRKPTTKDDGTGGYPTLETLEKLTRFLPGTVDVWELLHPDIERSLREREFYKAIEEDARKRGIIPAREKLKESVR